MLICNSLKTYSNPLFFFFSDLLLLFKTGISLLLLDSWERVTCSKLEGRDISFSPTSYSNSIKYSLPLN